MNPKLTAERLDRGATVFIRQSTPGQVLFIIGSDAFAEHFLWYGGSRHSAAGLAPSGERPSWES